MQTTDTELAPWLAEKSPKLVVDFVTDVFSKPLNDCLRGTPKEDERLLDLLKNFEKACKKLEWPDSLFRERLMSLFRNIPDSTLSTRNEDGVQVRSTPIKEPAFLKTKCWIFEQVAAGWVPERTDESTNALIFLVQSLDEKMVPRPGIWSLDETRLVSQRERDKVHTLIKERIDQSKFTADNLTAWLAAIEAIEFPKGLKQILETARDRRRPDWTRRLEEALHEASPELCDALPGIVIGTRELDKGIGHLMDELRLYTRPEIAKLELYINPDTARAKNGIEKVGICIRFLDDCNEDATSKLFERSKAKVIEIAKLYSFDFPVYLWPRGGPDNLAWGLKDWMCEPFTELSELRFRAKLIEKLTWHDGARRIHPCVHPIEDKYHIDVWVYVMEPSRFNIEDEVKKIRSAFEKFLESQPVTPKNIVFTVRNAHNYQKWEW